MVTSWPVKAAPPLGFLRPSSSSAASSAARPVAPSQRQRVEVAGSCWSGSGRARRAAWCSQRLRMRPASPMSSSGQRLRALTARRSSVQSLVAYAAAPDRGAIHVVAESFYDGADGRARGASTAPASAKTPSSRMATRVRPACTSRVMRRSSGDEGAAAREAKSRPAARAQFPPAAPAPQPCRRAWHPCRSRCPHAVEKLRSRGCSCSTSPDGDPGRLHYSVTAPGRSRRPHKGRELELLDQRVGFFIELPAGQSAQLPTGVPYPVRLSGHSCSPDPLLGGRIPFHNRQDG